MMFKQYDISKEYKNHVIDYIKNNSGKNPLSIWYLLNTIDIEDKSKRFEFLMNNLKDEYAVKAEDFIESLTKKNEKILLFQYLRITKCFYLNYGELELTETYFYKNSVKSIENIFNLKYKDALYIYKNIYSFPDLFKYFTPVEKNKQEQESIIFDIVINFSEKMGPMKIFFDSLEKIYNFWIEFFPNDKRKEINDLKTLKKTLENSILKDFENIQNKNKFYIEKYIKDFEEGGQLKDSLFFIGIYNHYRKNKNNEEDSYNKAKNLFSDLKNLGINNDINSLGDELKKIIISSIQNNRERLNNELNFIKNYFFKDKNEKDIKYNYFNISKLKKEILKLIDNNNINIINDELMFEVDGGEEDNNENDGIIYSKEQIEKEKKRLIDTFNNLEEEYIFISRKINLINVDDEEYNSLINSFQNIFIELFKINFGFAKFKNEEFYKHFIIFCKKIYLNNVDIDLLKDENSLILISEFFDILESLKKNGKITKKIIIFLLLQKMKELNNKYDNKEIIELIIDLFVFIRENVNEQDSSKLLIELLIKESRKKEENNFYSELLKLIFSNNSFNFLINDLTPFIDSILSNKFFKCLDFEKKIERDNIEISFEKSNYSKFFQVIKDNIYNIKIEEMILFYFETKIMNLLDNSFNENDYCNKDNTKYYYLEYFLKYLENFERNKNRNKFRDELLKLFSIAYIKCYYYKVVNYLYNNYIEQNNTFFELLDEGNNNSFKISMMFYILKIIYGNINNVFELEIDNNRNLNIFRKIKEKIKENGYWDLVKVLNNKNSGFDFIILPNKDQKIFFEVFDYILEIKKNCINQDNCDKNLINNFNKLNDIDLLYCVLLNIIFSFYYKNYLFEDNNKIIKWLNEIISKNEIKILKDNQILIQIFQLFINQESYREKILSSANSQFLSYQQLLCISLSIRFILNIIKFNNKNGLLYNFINNAHPKDIFDKNKEIFNLYLNENNKDQRDINYLTYKIIRYIICSFILISNLLNKIKLEETYQMVEYQHKEEDEGNYLLNILFMDFDFIKNDLLKTLGIKNIIIFFNSIFDDVSNIINNIQLNYKEKEIKDIEQNLEKIINEKISIYKQSIEDYYKTINEFNKENKIEDNNKSQEFYDILTEKNYFFNSENKKEKLPYIDYLTYTNFCTYDDFKKQYLYFENDPKSYPIIDCIVKEKKILKIVEFIPKLNKFINNFYNKLLMNITEEEANDKIKNKFADIKFTEFNKSLKKFLEVYDRAFAGFEINDESKIYEVININKKENKIFQIYSWIIQEYNKFFETINVNIENKKYINEVIIQNCTENDYISFKHGNKSIQQRLKEIICSYSKRNRIYNINNKEEINTYDGGKIIYNFDLIENILEKEFVLCKRKFSEIQKLFIFSNNIFNNERNKILVDFNIKYTQKEINDKNIIDKIIEYLNKNNKNSIRGIYNNCLYLILYLVLYLKDINFKNKNASINYLIKIMEKENNIINEKFKNMFENLELNIDQIFSLYEIIEEKAFDILLEKLKGEAKVYDLILEEKVKDDLKNAINKNTLLNQDLIIKGIKKYIVRYCLGNNVGNNPILKNIKIEDIFSNQDIWSKNIFTDTKFQEEKNKLISLNQKENNLLIYFYGIIFKNLIESVIDINDNEEDKIDFDKESEDDNSLDDEI